MTAQTVNLYESNPQRSLKKINVLFNTYPTAFLPPGGGEVQLLKTKAALQKLGVNIKLFNLWAPQFDTVDIVHHFSLLGDPLHFCISAKKINLPVVVSPILWLEKHRKDYPFSIIGRVLDMCDLVLVNSQSELQQISNFFKIDKNKFFITRNGVEPVFAKKISPDLFRKEFGINRPFLLNVGNIEGRKNQLALIRVTKKIGIDLIMLGHVRDKNYLNKCLQEGNKCVRYLGYIKHASPLLRSAYSACELFVLPSHMETPGLAALEAAAAQAKILVTEEGSTKEYFQDMATYVNPYDENDIYKGIISALNKEKNPLLQKHILENFTWEKTAQQVMGAYNLILNKQRARL